MRTLTARTCAHCHAIFQTTIENQRYCSPQHQNQAYKALHSYRKQGPWPVICATCKTEFMSPQPNGRFCSNDCRRASLTRTPSAYDRRLTTSTVGALHELKVACDLMERGFHVFRALSPSCECDLAFIHAGKLFRVEVTTGYITQAGKISYPRHAQHRYDILAVVLGMKEIHYNPTLP